mmetsp:Transcript_70270/g.164570  ORF Transcript_70270/g.164570 Transcript_70270/m.164570 type:complete len:233 (+) Transcript_70270:1446-2144(+)
MLPATAPDLQNLYILLAVALVERLVRLHVAVDPHPLVLLHTAHDILMGEIGLVVPPGYVLDRSFIQHADHPRAAVNARQQVRGQKVTSQYGNTARCSSVLRFELCLLLGDESLHAREILEHIDISDLQYAKRTGISGRPCLRCWLGLPGTRTAAAAGEDSVQEAMDVQVGIRGQQSCHLLGSSTQLLQHLSPIIVAETTGIDALQDLLHLRPCSCSLHQPLQALVATRSSMA